MTTFILILLLLVVLGGAAYYYFIHMESELTVGPSVAPSVAPSGESDVIVITENGSSRRESYIETPRVNNCDPGFSNKPSWCTGITPETEMNYVYDPVDGGINSDGNFTTTFNTQDNVCSDGTQDCVFEEKFDSERKMIGITNAKGEDFIKKLIDDIWSNRLNFDKIVTIRGSETSVKEWMKQTFAFDRETGKLSLTMSDGTAEIIPGNSSVRGPQQDQSKIMIPVGEMIMYIIFYYYSNNLPKPIIKLDFKSEKTLGEVLEEIRLANQATAPSVAPSVAPSTTEGYMIREIANY